MERTVVLSNETKVCTAHNYSISFIRFFSMCLIITCHFLQYFNNKLAWWFNIGVQIFLVISGYLYGQKEIKDSLAWIIKNSKKILLDYYIYLAIIIPTYYFVARDIIGKRVIYHVLTCYSTIKGLGHLWFIAYILFCYLITPFLQSFWNRYCKKSLFQAIISISVLLILIKIFMDLYLKFFCIAWIDCYVIGYFIGKIGQEYGKKVVKKLTLLTLPITFIMNSVRIYVEYIKKIEFTGKKAESFAEYKTYAHACLGISIFLILLFLLDGRPWLTKFHKLLDWSDKYSYDIYIVHQFYILGPIGFMTMTKWSPVNIVIVLGLSLISGMILFKLRKISGRILACFKI